MNNDTIEHNYCSYRIHILTPKTYITERDCTVSKEKTCQYIKDRQNIEDEQIRSIALVDQTKIDAENEVKSHQHKKRNK